MHDLGSLPKWAQEEIVSLNSDNTALNERIADVLEGERPQASDPIPAELHIKHFHLRYAVERMQAGLFTRDEAMAYIERRS